MTDSILITPSKLMAVARLPRCGLSEPIEGESLRLIHRLISPSLASFRLVSTLILCLIPPPRGNFTMLPSDFASASIRSSAPRLSEFQLQFSHRIRQGQLKPMPSIVQLHTDTDTDMDIASQTHSGRSINSHLQSEQESR